MPTQHASTAATQVLTRALIAEFCEVRYIFVVNTCPELRMCVCACHFRIPKLNHRTRCARGHRIRLYLQPPVEQWTRAPCSSAQTRGSVHSNRTQSRVPQHLFKRISSSPANLQELAQFIALRANPASYRERQNEEQGDQHSSVLVRCGMTTCFSACVHHGHQLLRHLGVRTKPTPWARLC